MKPIMALVAAASILAVAGTAGAAPIPYSEMKREDMSGHHDRMMAEHKMDRHMMSHRMTHHQMMMHRHMMMRHRMMMRHHHMDH